MTQTNDTLVVSIRDLKANVSKYLRQLENGEFRHIVVRRYKTPIAAFIPVKPE